MPPDRNLSQTFSRGLAVLRHLNERNGTTAGQVARRAGLNEVIVRRLLDTLVAAGFADKAAKSGQYWLTPHINALASGYAEDRWIVEIAEPALNRLGRTVVWPVTLVTPSGLSLVVRANTDQASPLTLHKSPIGQRYSLPDSASGPAYLAFCDARERESLVTLLWNTERQSLKSSYPSKATLFAHLANIRRRGYCIFDGGERISALAVPVARDGRVCGALSLRYFTSAVSGRDAVRRYLPPLEACAREIGIQAAPERAQGAA